MTEELDFKEHYRDPLWIYYHARTKNDDVTFILKQCIITDDTIPCELQVYVRGHGISMTPSQSNPTLMLKGHDPLLTVEGDIHVCLKLAEKIARNM